MFNEDHVPDILLYAKSSGEKNRNFCPQEADILLKKRKTKNILGKIYVR